MSDLTQEEFGKRYHISARTLQEWEQGRRECPSYVAELLERSVVLDFGTADKDRKYALIIERAKNMEVYKGEDLFLRMDLESADLKFKLRLDDLIKANDIAFGQEIRGIIDNAVRTEYPIKNFGTFVPRFADYKYGNVYERKLAEAYEQGVKDTTKKIGVSLSGGTIKKLVSEYVKRKNL